MHPFWSHANWKVKRDASAKAEKNDDLEFEQPERQILPELEEGVPYTHTGRVVLWLGQANTSEDVRRVALKAMRTGAYEEAGKKARKALDTAIKAASGTAPTPRATQVPTFPRIRVASMNVSVVSAVNRTNLAIALKQQGVAIACLQETRAKTTTRTICGDYVLWCTGATGGNWGIGAMVHVSLEHQVSIDTTSDRVIKICWNKDGTNMLTIVNGYAVCTPEESEVKGRQAKEYWEQVNATVTGSGTTRSLMVLQDANAKVSATRLRSEGHRYIANDTDKDARTDANGAHFLDMCGEQNLKIINFGEHAPVKNRYTFFPHGGGKGTITDYVTQTVRDIKGDENENIRPRCASDA